MSEFSTDHHKPSVTGVVRNRIEGSSQVALAKSSKTTTKFTVASEVTMSKIDWKKVAASPVWPTILNRVNTHDALASLVKANAKPCVTPRLSSAAIQRDDHSKPDISRINFNPVFINKD